MGRTTARVLGFLVFVACAATIAAGVWYWRTNGIFDDDDVASDDEPDDMDMKTDAGPHHHGGKKKKRGGGHRGKPRAARKDPGPPSIPLPSGPSGPSYESAIAGNNLHLAPGAADAPDLSDQQLAGPMRSGTFLDACGVPESTKATVKVAIKNGRAVGVSVYLSPPNAPLGWCVEKQVRGLYWPSNAKMDSFVTTY